MADTVIEIIQRGQQGIAGVGVPTGGLGAAYVNTYDAAGNALSDAFYVAMYW